MGQSTFDPVDYGTTNYFDVHVRIRSATLTDFDSDLTRFIPQPEGPTCHRPDPTPYHSNQIRITQCVFHISDRQRRGIKLEVIFEAGN